MKDYFKGMWVRRGEQTGVIQEIEETHLVVDLDYGYQEVIDLSHPDGWEYFTTVWEEGHWEPIESQ